VKKKIVEIVPIILSHITGKKNAFDVEKIFLISALGSFPRVSLLPDHRKKN
jgi:hypothetical protein